MHPAVAGLIGAGLALLGCLFAWLIHRGREGLRQIEAQRAGARVSAELTIPTIGIGAGAGCDGQVLVNQDMLGMFHDFTPKFVRRFAEVGDVMLEAYRAYDAAVKDGSFPAAEHTYAAPAGVLENL